MTELAYIEPHPTDEGWSLVVLKIAVRDAVLDMGAVDALAHELEVAPEPTALAAVRAWVAQFAAGLMIRNLTKLQLEPQLEAAKEQFQQQVQSLM